jgi:hypothetical protein
MDYRTGWNDAQITIVLALLHFREQLLTGAAAKGLDEKAQITIKHTMDGAIAIVVELDANPHAE